MQFTDAEAGAKEFPDLNARRFNYFEPAKRKQTHYEDVTVEVQPDPRHYLSQGWIYGFANGEVGYPLTWTKLKAWGQDQPEPERGPGSGGLPKNFSWPARLARVPRPQRRVGDDAVPLRANVVRQINANIEVARQAKGFDQWNPNWVTFVDRHVGAWMHIEHILRLYVFSHANRPARPTCTTPRSPSTACTRSASPRTSVHATSRSVRRSRPSTARRTWRRGTPTRRGRAPASWSRR